MDPFKQMFGKEGCGSSESGWTIYIASSMEEDDYDFNDHEEHQDYNDDGAICNDEHGNETEDSDDSMISDASSVPHRECKRDDGQSSHGRTSSKRRKEAKLKRFSLFSKKNKNDKGRDEKVVNDRRFATMRKCSK
ncbi:hypothetical protein K2173_026004 [Erythroxylum novogranatense]|uniref:Uncharacterized protein n=1 Tax=Erythroxylum novogranatense TaxID=1862640 RepID=A0AAV8SI15_9ROSI|nr:hypothetical protein K2173_026004 [Erythroxylum novogranatense]